MGLTYHIVTGLHFSNLKYVVCNVYVCMYTHFVFTANCVMCVVCPVEPLVAGHAIDIVISTKTSTKWA